MRSNRKAPARHVARAGAFVLVAVVAACAGCDAPPGAEGPRVLELANDTIRLEAGITLHDVAVRRAEEGDFDPAHVEASTGDIVRFVAEDNGGHALVFDGSALAHDARAFLERSGQLRSPPFVERGSTWIITLDGAPPGEYPFRCSTHDRAGRLSVGPG